MKIVKIPECLVASIERLPSFSPVAKRLVELLSDPDRLSAALSEQVELDAGLTAAVLGSASFAVADSTQPIRSVKQAVTCLGGPIVLTLAFSVFVPGFLGSLQGYEAERGVLWRHSLRAAIAARQLASCCQSPLAADLAFTAGLLHDIGKLVLAEHLLGHAQALTHELATHRFATFIEAEREALGICHPEAGVELARRWGLSAPLEAAIGFHHEPARAPDPFAPLVYVVHVADLIAMMGGDATGVDALAYHLDPGYSAHVKLSSKEFDSLVLRVDLEMEQTMRILGAEGGQS